MESVWPSLPKLDGPGVQDVTAPVIRAWDGSLVMKLALQGLDPSLEHLPSPVQGSALPARPSPDLAASRPTVEVRLRFCHRNLVDTPLDTYLCL